MISLGLLCTNAGFGLVLLVLVVVMIDFIRNQNVKIFQERRKYKSFQYGRTKRTR